MRFYSTAGMRMGILSRSVNFLHAAERPGRCPLHLILLTLQQVHRDTWNSRVINFRPYSYVYLYRQSLPAVEVCLRPANYDVKDR